MTSHPKPRQSTRGALVFTFCAAVTTTPSSALRSRPLLRRCIRGDIERGPSLSQPAPDICCETRTLDVETDFAERSIGACIGRRPVQTGEHKMIIIPQKKLAVQLTIVNLNQPNASEAAKAARSLASCFVTGPDGFE